MTKRYLCASRPLGPKSILNVKACYTREKPGSLSSRGARTCSMTMTQLMGLTLGDLAESRCPFDRLPTAPTERAVDSHPRMETGGPEFLSLSPSPEGVLKLFHKAFAQKKAKIKSRPGRTYPTFGPQHPAPARAGAGCRNKFNSEAQNH